MLGPDYKLAGAKFELPVEGSYVAEFHSAAPRSRRGSGARAYQRLAGADSDGEAAGAGYAASEDEDEVEAAGSAQLITATAAKRPRRPAGAKAPFLRRNVAKGKEGAGKKATGKRKRGS